MKENQNDPRNQDKTGKESTQKTTTDGNKKETNPNHPLANPNGKQDGTQKDQQDQDKKKPNVQDPNKKA